MCIRDSYTGLEIKDDNKVKVTFEEAKNDKDEDFTTNHADTYKAVYYVEPVNQDVYKRQTLWSFTPFGKSIVIFCWEDALNLMFSVL